MIRHRRIETSSREGPSVAWRADEQSTADRGQARSLVLEGSLSHRFSTSLIAMGGLRIAVSCFVFGVTLASRPAYCVGLARHWGERLGA
jgi:hypothetical protein